MRSKVAKRIRREVYGDQAHRDTKYYISPNGQIICVGLRREFKRRKKVFRNGLLT